MILQRFYDEALAQASYMIGCAATGEALVIDPNRWIEDYLEAAAAQGLRITAVTETHIHADYLSGTRELAHRTGAITYLSQAGPPEWQYQFGSEGTVVWLHDGSRFDIGRIQLEVWHTPGHTPEHLVFLVTDGAVANEPMGFCSGDFLFVGDVGRPDLLEKAAQVTGSSEAAARELYRSLGRLRALPDHLQIWPGHGAGSACGKGMSAVPQSTLGYERRYNWALQPLTEAEFVAMVLAGQPEPPKYFGVMKRLNREGPPLLNGLPKPGSASTQEVANLLDRGGWLIDARPAPDFATEHIAGSLNIPFNRSFTTWVGSLLPYDREFMVILPESIIDQDRGNSLVRRLVSIGLDNIKALIPANILTVWKQEGRESGSVPQIDPSRLATRTGSIMVIDVRGEAEWRNGHLPGAHLIPLPELPDRLTEIPGDREIAVHCQGGARSAIAASFLRARGVLKVENLAGGFAAWANSGLPVEVSP